MTANYQKTKVVLNHNGSDYTFYSLPKLGEILGVDLNAMPFSARILLENCLRNHMTKGFASDGIKPLANWLNNDEEIPFPFLPARILHQDFTGIPILNDMTALRSAVQQRGDSPNAVNPRIPVDLVIDHSVQVQAYGCEEACEINEAREFEQNLERYRFLKWSEGAYENLRILPPGLGICHQVNLEYLGKVAFIQDDGANKTIYPDSVLGTDSHTTMINGLGVLGWGVGGIEALAAMLAYPSEMTIPEVIGVRLFGRLPSNATATDLTLTLTSKLRAIGVVGRFVEIFGESYARLPVETRAMISNMTPESGATVTYCPVDSNTLDYLERTGRSKEHIGIVEEYFKAQQLFWEPGNKIPHYSTEIELDLSEIQPVLSGPKRPHDIFPAAKAKEDFQSSLSTAVGHKGFGLANDEQDKPVKISLNGETVELNHGSVLIAAITSCTNTSDPSVILSAGLLARNAAAAGLMPKPWVKTSLAPGSRVVKTYLEDADLLKPLANLGFNIVGYGCTTCIGNSGPLDETIRDAVVQNNLVCAGVLSGNRNFEGRIHPYLRANYLAAPPLVIAYALAGKMGFDFEKMPLGISKDGESIFLRDIYPSREEIDKLVEKATCPEIYEENYNGLYEGNQRWNDLQVPQSKIFPYEPDSNMISEPDFLFRDGPRQKSNEDIIDAYALAVLGDSITTDHISPAGSIVQDVDAGKYLKSKDVQTKNFITFGARRGHTKIMHMGAFSNPRLRNHLADGKEGGFTKYIPSGKMMTIYQAAEQYMEAKQPLVILAGKGYGAGSSRDWAAKATYLLGVRAVIAESYERIHRTNLVCMGVLPLQFKEDESVESLGLTGEEQFTIKRVSEINDLNQEIHVSVRMPEGSQKNFDVIVRIETPLELAYFQAGGLARKVLADLQ